MTWTYTSPSASDRDAVRFLIGDVVEETPTLSNEEIQFTLDESGGDRYRAAYECCNALASQYGRLASSKSVGDLSLSYGSRANEFRAQADRMLALASRRSIGTPWASPDALKRADEKAVNGSTGTEFWTGQQDNPGSSGGDLV